MQFIIFLDPDDSTETTPREGLLLWKILAYVIVPEFEQKSMQL